MTTSEEKLKFVRENIGSFPDFPKAGILFRDVFSVLKNPKAFSYLTELLCEHVDNLKEPINAVVGLDSRGFLFGPQIALHCHVPFVPVRKRGKLPGEVERIEFQLEYGSDVFEIQKGSIKPGQRVLVVDDMLATGGSLKATCELIHKLGSKVQECVVIIEEASLNGRQKIPCPVHALVIY